jgi:tryptophan synthase alpha chain
VELQLPFSEPIADGPVFVRANQEAIHAPVHRDDYFDLVGRAARTFPVPLLFMGYYNSVFRMGEGAFCERLAAAGAHGYIVADLPPEEARTLHAAGRARGLDPVLQASGFVYCVARKGVTGKRTELSLGVEAFLGRCRAATVLPLALGFGLKTPTDVRGVRGLADIAIVGTACLETWEAHGPGGYADFLRSMAAATR